MRKYLLLLPLAFLGCSVSNTTTKVKNFTKCYIHQLPAPFWVCYQSSFLAVGKVFTDKVSRLKQEEAFSNGVAQLINKLQNKTKILLNKLDINDEKRMKQVLDAVKSYVIVNAIQGSSWYAKKDKMLYVEVKINDKDFKDFLLRQLGNIDKNKYEIAFNESF
ncbi:hypothetical protein [Caminibacter pacificus]